MCDFEWEEAGLPERYRGVTLDMCPPDSAEKVREFCLGHGTQVMVIQGGNGTCKTQTACAAFTERADAGKNLGLYLSAKYQLCPLFRSARLSNFAMSEYELYQKYYTTPFLAIDEVGKGDDRNLERTVIRNILSARYDRNVLTLIITNLTVHELLGDGESSEGFLGLGNDIKSRFHETAAVITMAGDDWRGQNRMQPYTERKPLKASVIKCLLCGSPMDESGSCTNPKCTCHI